MTFGLLALICAAGLLGPLLATPRRAAIPVVVGELLVGIVLGPMGFGRIDATDPTFAFLASIGFALVMFVVGSHVPLQDAGIRPAFGVGALRAAVVGAASVPVGLLLSEVFGTGHAALYAVLLASSSAALVLPILDELRLSGPEPMRLLPQVAVADTACIVAVPLVMDPHRVGRVTLGAVVVVGLTVVLYLVLRETERRGWRRSLHDLSEERRFALELRINLAILFALCAVAIRSHVSVMLAGFGFGLAVAAIGEPRRLARQLFAVTDGFFAPLFFVWLGASLDLAPLSERPGLIVLGLLLGLGATLTHLVPRLLGQPIALGALASAQMGVPVAAATLGTESHLLAAGEPAALILGAAVSVAIASTGAALAARARAGPKTAAGDVEPEVG